MVNRKIFWFLGMAGIFAIMLIFLFVSEKSVTNLNVEEFEKILNSDPVFVINTHTPYIGEIEGTNLVAENWQNIVFYKNELPEDKSTPIAVYCRSGSMSSSVAQQLSDLGYTKIYNLEGGMNSWEQSGRKIIKANS